jgi:hypothetical protein
MEIYGDDNIIKQRFFHLFAYPLIMFLCWLLVSDFQLLSSQISIERILDFFSLDYPILDAVAFFMVNLSGTLNVIAYGYNTLFQRITCRNCVFDCDKADTDDENLSLYIEEDGGSESILQSLFSILLLFQRKTKNFK